MSECKTYTEKIERLKEYIGPAWDDVVCICREMLKDNPCSLGCKEFHNEDLPNHHSELKPKESDGQV